MQYSLNYFGAKFFVSLNNCFIWPLLSYVSTSFLWQFFCLPTFEYLSLFIGTVPWFQIQKNNSCVFLNILLVNELFKNESVSNRMNLPRGRIAFGN